MHAMVLFGVLFAAGAAGGALMHRADYCLVAAFRDPVLFGHWVPARALVLGISLNAVLFEALRISGVVPAYPFPLFGPASLASGVGGLAFGAGMVLAGGCVVGTLYRVAQGKALSAVALLGILVGSGLYAEVHPVWARIARAGQVFPRATTLPQALGLPPAAVLLPLAGLGLWRSLGWARRGLLDRGGLLRGGLSPLAATVGLSLVSAVVCAASSMPIGVTTCYTKIVALFESAVFPGYAARNAFFRLTPLSVRLPWAGMELRGGPGPSWDGIALVQGAVILGIVAGAAASSAAAGEWRLRLRAPGRQYASALCGGVLMGLGARLGSGCNVWHLWGGLPILSLNSLVFVAGLLPGVWLGVEAFRRWVVPATPHRTREP